MALTAEQQAMDFNPELQDVTRQRKLADLLMSQGMQQPQGQMISGHYVAPSWTQQLNPMANILAGEAISNRADTKQLAYADALRGKQQEAIQNYISAKTPGEKFAIGTGRYAPAALQASAYEMLKPIHTKEGETVTERNLTSEGGLTTLTAGGMSLPAELKSAAIRLGLDPKNSASWGPAELAAIDAKVLQDKRATTPTVSVSMGKDLSSKVGDIMEASQAATTAAYQTKDSANRILTTLSKNNALQGPMADTRMTGLQLADMVGATGKSDKEKLDNTRTLIQESAMLAANSAKLNKTPGAVSDYEQKLYTRIAGGDINLTPSEMALIAKRAKEGSEYQIQRHNAKMNYITSDKELKKLAPFYDVQAPAPSENVVDYNSLPK
jgi:hypothetical protein